MNSNRMDFDDVAAQVGGASTHADYNPYHDKYGRFTGPGGGGGGAVTFVSTTNAKAVEKMKAAGGAGGGKAEAPKAGPKLKDGHSEMEKAMPIHKESDKAVQIDRPYSRIQGYQDKTWLPKSQVSTHEGKVVGMAPWLAKREGYGTKEGEAKEAAAFSAGKARYANLLSEAKAAGVPGVRERMKTETIKQKMREHGLRVDGDHYDSEELDFVMDIKDTQVQRYDFAELQARVDADGFLHDTPIVGRVGIQEYRRADGTIQRELRLPEEVFHPDALASAKGKPISVDHADGKVTKKNAHRVTIGTMLDALKQDGENVRADIVIHSPDSIGDRRQLSLGYTAKLDETPGEHPIYGRYDSIQREITINHLSVVKSARAGPVARLNLDGNEDFSTPQEHAPMTVKVKLDSGIEYDAVPEVAAELAKLRADASSVAEQLKTIPQLQAKVDALEAETKGFNAKLEAARAEGKVQAEARAKLDSTAAAFKVDTAGKTDREVKEAVILAVRKDAKLEGKTAEYIDAAFELAIELKGDAAMATQRQAAQHNDGAPKGKSAADKRAEMIANMTKKV